MDVKNKILFVTDAWHPQVNGVVVLVSALLEALHRRDVDTEVIHPGLFPRVPAPKYPEIQLALTPWRLNKYVEADSVQWVHIVTEGPLGLAARAFCKKRAIPFTTAIHTKFPEYVNILFGAPQSWGYRYLRWFHSPANATIVQTPGQQRELRQRGLVHLHVVGGGVDTNLFRPKTHVTRDKPVLLYVGRVSREKNIEAFLDMDIDSEKIVVGDGPDRNRLENEYSQIQFRGYRQGEELVREYAQADCLVFPSRTDTFGLVLIEAMACGTPVASFPTTGPLDVVQNGVSGIIDEDLQLAVKHALKLDRATVRNEAMHFSWERVAERFMQVHDVSHNGVQ